MGYDHKARTRELMLPVDDARRYVGLMETGACPDCGHTLAPEARYESAVCDHARKCRTTVVTIDLVGHGQFKAAIGDVAAAHDFTWRQLAGRIVECYGGGCGKASTKAYWLGYPKHVLAIVYAGMVAPKN